MASDLHPWMLRGLWAGAAALLPVWAMQALYVRRSALRLPAAEGPREGEAAGGGELLRLAVLGESPVAGVGVSTQQEALTACLAAELGARLRRDVRWQALGENGITVESATDRLVPSLGAEPADLIVVALGVNDTLDLTPMRRFRRALARLVERLRVRSRCPIVFSSVPPLGRFELLPHPLRGALGLRAMLLDHELRRFTARRQDTVYARVRFDVHDPSMMARDRFHPSAAGYRNWASQLAAVVMGHGLWARG